MFKRIQYVFAIVWLMISTLTACSTRDETTVDTTSNEEAFHWSYDGRTGPEHWNELDASCAIAKDGKEQSPINIVTDNARNSADVNQMPFIDYVKTSYGMNNNGHTIELIPMDEDNSIELDGVKYILQQVHFHDPSEHQLDGKYYEMEAHFVHKDADGNIAVIGVLLTSGQENELLSEAFSKLPKEMTEPGDYVPLDEKLDLSGLMAVTAGVYRYTGSLTTPPCTEGVKWSICQYIAELSNEQIANFKDIYKGNNRPVQEINGRTVYSCLES